jgi:hypothetical protein
VRKIADTVDQIRNGTRRLGGAYVVAYLLQQRQRLGAVLYLKSDVADDWVGGERGLGRGCR